MDYRSEFAEFEGVTYLNAAAQTLLGVGPNQALGKSIAELTRGAESAPKATGRKRSQKIFTVF